MILFLHIWLLIVTIVGLFVVGSFVLVGTGILLAKWLSWVFRIVTGEEMW